jgi:hypothetical protein
MMKVFIRRLILFGIFLLCLLVISGRAINGFIKHQLYSPKAFQLTADKNLLFFGDSHGMCAFNDSIIPHSFNASKNSESYFQTFQKIKILLEANPQVKTVVLSYSPHNLASRYDALILYGDIYYPLLDRESRDLMSDAGNYGLIPGYSVTSGSLKSKILLLRHKLILGFCSFRWNWGLPRNMEPYITFLRSSNNNPARLYLNPLFTPQYVSTNSNLNDETINNAIERHFDKPGSACKFSSIMAHYLMNIARLCKTHNVRLILFGTPEHPRYTKMVPRCYKDYSDDLAKEFENKYENVRYVNYTDIFIPDSLYGDGDHLNYLGNIVFSKMLITDSIFQRN